MQKYSIACVGLAYFSLWFGRSRVSETRRYIFLRWGSDTGAITLRLTSHSALDGAMYLQARQAISYEVTFTRLCKGGGLFGDRVKEPGFLQDILLPSLQAGGLLAFIDENGRIFTPNLRQRGWNATLRIGKIFPRLRLPGQNPNCGPFIEVGVGYLSHRILIDKARSERLPLLEGEYLKGLDRLTEGWGLTQAVGYRFFSNRGLINFFVALEAGQYFTRGQRGYLYDKGVRDTGLRRDFWQGFRIGWIVPLYEKAPIE